MLTKDGFKRKTRDDLIYDMGLKAQELFGENINLTPRSFMGLLIRLYAFFLAIVWELAEKVYYSAFIDKAEGKQLDDIGRNKGIPREEAAESTVDLVFKGTPGLIVPELKRYTTETDIYFLLTESVTLDETGTGSGCAVSIDAGVHTLVPANSITIQAEPMEGLTSVTNPEASAGGRDRETDREYRKRLKTSTAPEGKGTAPAIRSALYGTTGVRAANAIINNKNQVDEYGNPPKSVHAYVLGGDRQAIGETLLDSVGGGIETVGQEAVMIKDISGIEHEMRFDYATSVNVQIKITLTKNSAFPADGDLQLKDNLVRLIGGVDSAGAYWTGYVMGQDVIYSQLFSRIYQIPGIDDVTLAIGKEGEALGANNIIIGPNEVATTSAALIEVA